MCRIDPTANRAIANIMREEREQQGKPTRRHRRRDFRIFRRHTDTLQADARRLLASLSSLAPYED